MSLSFIFFLLDCRNERPRQDRQTDRQTGQMKDIFCSQVSNVRMSNLLRTSQSSSASLMRRANGSRSRSCLIHAPRPEWEKEGSNDLPTSRYLSSLQAYSAAGQSQPDRDNLKSVSKQMKHSSAQQQLHKLRTFSIPIQCRGRILDQQVRDE